MMDLFKDQNPNSKNENSLDWDVNHALIIKNEESSEFVDFSSFIDKAPIFENLSAISYIKDFIISEEIDMSLFITTVPTDPLQIPETIGEGPVTSRAEVPNQGSRMSWWDYLVSSSGFFRWLLYLYTTFGIDLIQFIINYEMTIYREGRAVWAFPSINSYYRTANALRFTSSWANHSCGLAVFLYVWYLEWMGERIRFGWGQRVHQRHIRAFRLFSNLFHDQRMFNFLSALWRLLQRRFRR